MATVGVKGLTGLVSIHNQSQLTISDLTKYDTRNELH